MFENQQVGISELNISILELNCINFKTQMIKFKCGVDLKNKKTMLIYPSRLFFS